MAAANCDDIVHALRLGLTVIGVSTFQTSRRQNQSMHAIVARGINTPASSTGVKFKCSLLEKVRLRYRPNRARDYDCRKRQRSKRGAEITSFPVGYWAKRLKIGLEQLISSVCWRHGKKRAELTIGQHAEPPRRGREEKKIGCG